MEELGLEARVCQLVLKRVFDRLFSVLGSTRADPTSFSCLDATLNELFDNLTAPLVLEWEHGSFSQEDRLELGKLLADLKGFYETQRKHLLLRKDTNPFDLQIHSSQ